MLAASKTDETLKFFFLQAVLFSNISAMRHQIQLLSLVPYMQHAYAHICLSLTLM